MENPIQILHREHMILMDAASTTERVQKIKDNKKYRWLIHDLILFFRNYTEIFHHPKEENVLYPIIKNRSRKINDHLMYEICDNHEDFKALIAEMENHFENRDYELLRKTVDTYLIELVQHIEMEEREILHISENLLVKSEIEKANEDFKTLDEKLGEHEKEKLEKIIANINFQLKNEKI